MWAAWSRKDLRAEFGYDVTIVKERDRRCAVLTTGETRRVVGRSEQTVRGSKERIVTSLQWHDEERAGSAEGTMPRTAGEQRRTPAAD